MIQCVKYIYITLYIVLICTLDFLSLEVGTSKAMCIIDLESLFCIVSLYITWKPSHINYIELSGGRLYSHIQCLYSQCVSFIMIQWSHCS